MKNGLIFLSLFLWSAALSAQSLKVTVRDANGPLAYANIWLNDLYLVSADSTGTVSIPETLLTPGDTISSTFMGFEPAFVLYDEALRAAGAVTLVHEKDRIYEIEEVVVSSRMGAWEAFRQFVTPSRAAFVKVVTGNFEANVRMPDGSVRSIDGTFSTENAFNSKDYLYSRKSEIIVNHGDTTGVSRMLMRNLSFLKALSNGNINFLYNIHKNIDSQKTNPYRTLTYLGQQDDRRYFTFTYVSPKIRGTNQSFWQIDAESKQPRSYHFTTTAELGNEAKMHSLSIDLVPERRRMRATGIEADFREAEGMKMELKLTDLTMK